jgi:hypothetical protein
LQASPLIGWSVTFTSNASTGERLIKLTVHSTFGVPTAVTEGRVIWSGSEVPPMAPHCLVMSMIGYDTDTSSSVWFSMIDEPTRSSQALLPVSQSSSLAPSHVPSVASSEVKCRI